MANYTVPQSSAGAVSGLYYVPSTVPPFQHPAATYQQQYQHSAATVQQFQHPASNVQQFQHHPSTIQHFQHQASNFQYYQHPPSNVQQFQNLGSAFQYFPHPASNVQYFQHSASNVQYNSSQRQILKPKNNIAPGRYNNLSKSSGGRGDTCIPYQDHLLPPQMHPKYKTEMCNKYQSNVGCPYGDSCVFRHPEESFSKPPVTFKNRTQHPPVFSTRNGNPNNKFFASNSVRNSENGKPTVDSKQGIPHVQFMAEKTMPKNNVPPSRYHLSKSSSGKGDSHHQYQDNLPLHMHPKYKTEMCNKYQSNMGCPYGDSCMFRHPEESYSKPPGNFKNRIQNQPPPSTRNGNPKNKSVFGLNMVRYAENGKSVADYKRGMPHIQFLNEKTLPKFVKFASKVPKNGMRRHNSTENIGRFTYVQVFSFKKRMNARLNEEKESKERKN